MKNVIEFDSTQDFTCCTPDGGEYTECPICGGFPYQYDLEYDEDTTDNEDIDLCERCLILYKVGCVYIAAGCTDSTHNGHFVGKWKDLSTNEVYIGMPQFESIDEWKEKINKIEILEWVCPNNGKYSDEAPYPYSTHPQYYGCNLAK